MGFCNKSISDISAVHSRRPKNAYRGESSVVSGHRYYDSEIGRWLSRDPIEEDGGINLYACCYNSLIDYTDTNGQKPTKKLKITKTELIKCVTKEIIAGILNKYDRLVDKTNLAGNVRRFCSVGCEDKEELNKLLDGLVKKLSLAEHVLSFAGCLGLTKSEVEATQKFKGEKQVVVKGCDSVTLKSKLEVTWDVKLEDKVDISYTHVIDVKDRVWNSTPLSDKGGSIMGPAICLECYAGCGTGTF